MGDNLSVNLGVGASHQKVDGYHANLADVQAGITIPIGQRFSLEPSAGVSIGGGSFGSVQSDRFGTVTSNGIMQFRGRIDARYQATPQVAFTAGAGVTHTRFGSASVTNTDTYEISDFSDDPPMPYSEKDLRQIGDMYGTQVITSTETSGSGNTVVYGAVGAEYQPTQRFKFNVGFKAGQKSANSGSEAYAAVVNGKQCTGIEYKTEMIDDFELKYPTNPQIEAYSESQSYSRTHDNKSFVAGVSGGVEYRINNNFAVGIDATKGLNSNSDDFVGAKIKVNF